MTDTADPSASDEVAYAYKASLLGPPWQFRLRPDGLEWTAGSRRGCISYARITRLRLSFRPLSMQHYRFLAEIWPSDGGRLRIASTSWRGIVEQERLDLPYSTFIRELHARIAAARPQAVFEIGLPAMIYWPGATVFAGIMVALAALIVRALQLGQWTAAVLVAAFFAVSLWRIGGFLRRNRPRTYAPDCVPSDLLPTP